MAATARDSSHYIILQQAAEWFALLESDGAGDAEHARWRCWLDADPRHAATWRQVQAISGQFRALPAQPVRAALMQDGARGRRAFAAMLVAAATGLALWWREEESAGGMPALAGGQGSAVGQLRLLRLPDGGSLRLDTDTLVDIDYGVSARRIVLRRGRIQVDTAPDTAVPARPLLVQTGEGSLRALGTRFEVAQRQQRTCLQVQQGAVEITTRAGAARVIAAGQGAQFDAARIAAPAPAGQAAPAWTRKLLLADNMRLGDFVRELSRYRRGYLGCAPEVAGLRLVGAYPLDDHEAIFAMLEASLPVQIARPLPWWVSIAARGAAG